MSHRYEEPAEEPITTDGDPATPQGEPGKPSEESAEPVGGLASDLDPTDQKGEPVMISGLFLGFVVVLLILLVIGYLVLN